MDKVIERQPAGIARRYAVLLLLFYLLAYILPLGARSLFVPDEARYAEIPREMIAGGSWVVPHLDGLRYFEKPVLGYWVNAGSLLLFGQNNFAVRLPSALAVGLSAWLLYLLVCRTIRREGGENRQLALPAALIYMSCAEVYVVGNVALLDSLFAFFLTATIIALFFASEAPPRSSRATGFLLLAGLSCGLAFLTKGFLAIAVPVLAVAPYLVWQRRYADLFRLSWLPILIAVLVALPWSILIQLKAPDFWRYFFWNEHIRRFMEKSAQHKASFWFFFLAAPGLFLPWSFVAPAAVPGIKKLFREQGAQGRLLRFSLCWLVLPFLFFSVSKGKLVTYILPCFPPFAVLLAIGLSRVLEERKSRAFQWGCVLTSLFFGLLLLVFLYLQLFGYKGFHPYSLSWKALLAGGGLTFLPFLSVLAFRARRGRDKILLFGLAPLLLFFSANFIMPGQTLERKAPGPLLERHCRHIGRKTKIIADDETLRAVCWYCKRSDVYLLGGKGELTYGLSYKDAAGRGINLKEAVKLIAKNPGKIVLIARQKNIADWRRQLPRPVLQDNSGPKGYVFWRY